MRFTASEKFEIIKLVDQSDLSIRMTLDQLNIPNSPIKNKERIMMKNYINYAKFAPLLILVNIILFFNVSAQPTDTSPGTGKLLDMTYNFDENTIYWPTAEPFTLEKLDWGVSEGGWWYASNNYGASEHGGTHVDAPIHFAEKGKTIDQIPLDDWIGPAIKIDVVSKCLSNRDYLLTVEDIKHWETKYGIIPDNAWVLMYTGIDTKFYPDKEKVLGTAKTGKDALPELSFPGFSVQAAEFLLNERNIKGIGLDTPSIDYGKSKDFKVHRICFAANKLAIENIANLDKLPAKGAILYAIPMLIKDGTGAPARVFAVLP